MRKLVKLLTVTVALGVLPASALAHRGATRAQRAALTQATRALSPSGSPTRHTPERCLKFAISTPASSWASVQTLVGRNGRVPRGCARYAANGVIIFHLQSGRWHFVTEGSDFTNGRRCVVPHVPKRVVADFKLCG
jgi:hypothetical protein